MLLSFLMCSRSTLRHADRNETRQQNSRVPEVSCETNGSVGNGKLIPQDFYSLTGFEFFCLCGISKTFLVTFCTKATVFSSVQKAEFIGLLKRGAGSCRKKKKVYFMPRHCYRHFRNQLDKRGDPAVSSARFLSPQLGLLNVTETGNNNLWRPRSWWAHPVKRSEA